MVVAGFLSEALKQNHKLTLDLGAGIGQGRVFYLRGLRPTSPAHPEVWEPAFEMTGFYSEALKQNHQLTLDLGAKAGKGQDTFTEKTFFSNLASTENHWTAAGQILGRCGPTQGPFFKGLACKAPGHFFGIRASCSQE